jgi:VanZ family protein
VKRWIEEHRILATLILVLLVMAMIFGFSAQTGEASGRLSDRIARFLVQLVSPDFDTWTAAMQEEICSIVGLVVRKAAHFTEYALLGLCLMLHLDAIGKKIVIKLPWLISWGIGTLYALTDEWHQGFVGGRHPAILDVTIDSCGVAVGVLVLVLLLRRRNRLLP